MAAVAAENCALPERTAQLYMKLAKLNLPEAPGVVAQLAAGFGMKAVAQSEPPKFVGTAPDPLAGLVPETARQWLLRIGFTTSDARAGEEGAQYRRVHRMREGKGWQEELAAGAARLS
jgi:hypothetical protein